MSGTMIEEIVRRHTDQDVEPGQVIWIDLDVRSARDFGGANVVKNFERWYPDERVEDPSKTFFTFDCVVPPKNHQYATNQQICRVFARRHGIKVFDCDRGIGSHVLLEEGIARPGSTVVGTDSHLNLLGAIGALGQGMGDRDIAFAFRTGRTWFEVPETLRIELVGEPSVLATDRDIAMYVLRTLGSSGGLGLSLEFHGPVIERMCLAGRITLASLATEMGAVTALIPPSEEVITYCASHSEGIEPVFPRHDADYSAVLRIDVSDIGPLVSRPPSPDNVVPLKDVAGLKVDSVFIGSCTNGRHEDISRVADIVEGRSVAEDVVAVVAPATREVYSRLLKGGEIEVLFDSGFIVVNPGCGGCATGQPGMTGNGQVQISTSNRNFPGKQGTGMTYLASPDTAAASAILGRLASVDEVM